MDAALYASYFQAVSPEDGAELPHELEFHYSIENQQNAAENEENLVFDHDFQKARVLDSSKRYEAQTVYLGVLVNSAVLWDGQPSQHDEGTKALPEACSTNAGNNGPVMAAGTLEMKNGKNPASSLYIDGQGIDLGMCTMEELEVFLGKFGFHPIVDENGASMRAIPSRALNTEWYTPIRERESHLQTAAAPLYSRLCPATGRAGRLRSGSVRFTGLKPAARRRFKTAATRSGCLTIW